MPTSAAAFFIPCPTAWRDSSTSGRLRALVSPEARSLRISTKSSGIGISLAVLALFPTMSAGRLMIGGDRSKRS